MNSVNAGNKTKLRRHFRKLRNALPASTQQHHERALAGHFFCSSISWRRGCVASYFASDGEVSTLGITERLLQHGRCMALPTVRSKTEMDFFSFTQHTQLVRGRFDILEPEESAAFVSPLCLTLILLPLMAFDERGYRLGRGGGYYDRHLKNSSAIRVGLAHELQATTALPKDEWDLPLDAVITESGWRSFTPRGRMLLPNFKR